MRQFLILHFFLIPCLLAAPLSAHAQRYADLFLVEGIEVDVKGPTAEDARVGAFREAAKRAWPKLWDKLADPSQVGKAPKMDDAALARIVTAVDVANENMSATRYIARISVSFDPGAVRAALARVGAAAGLSSTTPMLLLPVLLDGGAVYVYESNNIWARAWARIPLLRSKINYVRPDGTVADRILLSGAEILSRDEEALRSLNSRYRTKDSVIALARLTRSYPGGPIDGEFTAIMGVTQNTLGTVRVRKALEADLPALLDEAIIALDGLFNAALSKGALTTTAPGRLIGSAQAIGNLEFDIETPNANRLSALQAQIASLASVQNVSLSSLALGAISKIRLNLRESFEFFRYELQQIGLTLTPQGLIRQRRVEDALLARPLSRAEQAAQEALKTKSGGQ
jgi:hypothetical protein